MAGVVVAVVAVLVVGCVAVTQTLPAGVAATNLPTEQRWASPGSPPYICCWNADGQYVTFSFAANAGLTDLTLRYSAGNGHATRRMLLDGAVLDDNAVFAATPDWATWSTETWSTTLTAGNHQLQILFDSSAGSMQYMNLDSLTVDAVSPIAPAGVVVSVGYADTTAGISPWNGSPDTLFIGQGPECCLTSGPDNGKPGYDGGVIQVENTSDAPIRLDAITASFDGGSTPGSFDLWGGGDLGHLPQTVPAGGRVIVTMTSKFNFDTSDLFGETCIANSGVTPVVHVTINGTRVNYLDDHQILNSDGTDIVTCPGAETEQHEFTVLQPGHQPAAAPQNDVLPWVTGVATTDHVLSGFMGGWNASPPPTLSMQWMRCSDSGGNCQAIAEATGATYRPTASDVGHRLRLKVIAINATKMKTASSAPTDVVTAGPPTAQMGNTSTGYAATLVSNAQELGSVFTAGSAGVTTDFEFYARGAGSSQDFVPKIYSVVDGAPDALLAKGPTVTVPKGAKGTWYVADLSGVALTAGTQYYLALAPSGVFRGTYVGTETDGPLSFFVDYTP